MGLVRGVAVGPVSAGNDGALAMGAGDCVVLERCAGADSSGICVVVGAVIIGGCCNCAVGWGGASATGGLPLYGSGP